MTESERYEILFLILLATVGKAIKMAMTVMGRNDLSDYFSIFRI